jgi:Mrp family chromosome partitioning ATPase
MNAVHGMAKRPDMKVDDRPDAEFVQLARKIRKGSTSARPAIEAVPDPITTVYGALRGLVDQSQTGIVVHVVAATAGEGASSIASSIASTAATAGSGKVLLMDGKLPSRSPTIKRVPTTLEPKTEESKKTLLADHGPLAQASRMNGAGQGPFTGSICDGARNEKVDPDEVRAAYAAWRQEYDLVIVDCPPIASGRYIDLVPSAADHVILVVQAERLRPPVLIKVRETIEQQGGKILGVVLKDAKRYIPRFIYRFI